VALPFASNSAPISQALREIVVNVDEQGAAHVGGRTISDDELRSMIQNAVSANPDQKVSVRGDRRTAYSNVVHVLDICKAAGIQQPYLDTVLGE
jgi:biopolymer transport protein ExbD